MKQQFFLFAVIILTLVSFQSAFADVKVRSKQSMAGQTYENTTYIKGKRQRTDAMGGSMVNITQCDLRRAIQMNPSTKTFVVNEFGEIETTGNSPVNTKKMYRSQKAAELSRRSTSKTPASESRCSAFRHEG